MCSMGYKRVLLKQAVSVSTEKASLTTHIIIGIEDPGDVLGQISVQHSLNVVSNVNWGEG